MAEIEWITSFKDGLARTREHCGGRRTGRRLT